MTRTLSGPAHSAECLSCSLGMTGIGAATLLMAGCAPHPGNHLSHETVAAPSHAESDVAADASPLDPHLQADFVLVKKARRELILYRHGRPLRTYRISLGSHPVGPKEKEGDGRTPEGRYMLDWRNPHSKYYLSLHVSYPDARDRANAERLGVEPGGSIMVHGVGPQGRTGMTAAEAGDWTAGCIAVSDADMKEIWHAVRDGTPIEITS